MKYRIFVITITTLFLWSSCKPESPNSNPNHIQKENIKHPGFIHTVYFWFEEDADPQLKSDFINGLEDLAKVKSIQNVYYGPPAGTDRAVVDNSYDYAWITHFKTSEDHDAYQVDPIHLEFIEKYKSLWKEVKVYDNTVDN